MMTSNDLWLSLEGVLRDKGATDAWIAYALPDLQIAATQFASQAYGLGHALARSGEQLPNPGDAPPMHVVTEDDGSHWLELVPPETLDETMARWATLDAARTPTIGPNDGALPPDPDDTTEVDDWAGGGTGDEEIILDRNGPR